MTRISLLHVADQIKDSILKIQLPSFGARHKQSDFFTDFDGVRERFRPILKSLDTNYNNRHFKAKSRKYLGVCKVKKREKTRQVRENWSQQLEHKQVPKKWVGTRCPEGYETSKCFLPFSKS